MLEKWHPVLKFYFVDMFYVWPIVLLIYYTRVCFRWIRYEVKDDALHILYPARFFKRRYIIPLNDIEEIAPTKPWQSWVIISYLDKKQLLQFTGYHKQDRFMKYLSENGFEISRSDRTF